MIKAIIIDDEIKGSLLLEHKLKLFSSIIEVVKIFNDADIALQEVNAYDADVLFLDIEMPTMNGFQFLEKLGQVDFEIIFVTAYNTYILEALRANAVDYLLKPVDPEELASAINKLKHKIDTKDLTKSVTIIPSSAQSRIALSTLEGIYFVKKSEIIKIEAMSNYSIFHTTYNSKIVVSKTLKEFAYLLNESNFVKINRGTIVNLEYVVRYKKCDGGILELVGGHEIEVSASNKALLLEKLIHI